jgi:hypothetical protein
MEHRVEFTTRTNGGKRFGVTDIDLVQQDSLRDGFRVAGRQVVYNFNVMPARLELPATR